MYGGAAGGGKTFGVLLEACRHTMLKEFRCVIFRRNAAQILNSGGLWDDANKIFPQIGGKPKLTPRPSFTFHSGAKIEFAHLQYDTDVLTWQGSAIHLIVFDELCHFTRAQFFYLLSRNRGVGGIRPYIRATCNPDPDSFVAKLIEWWIDQDTGYPIQDRSGVIRYFARLDDQLIWGDSPEDVALDANVPVEWVKSFTFIASSVYDNKILLANNPEYLANLAAMGNVDKMRLLHGNWKIKPAAGMYFPRNAVRVIGDVDLKKVVKWARAWDLAATTPTEANPSPDRTAGVLIGRYRDGRFVVADATEVCYTAEKVRELVKRTAENDRRLYKNVTISIPQDPGQAGKEQAASYGKMLAGHRVKIIRPTGSKIVRAEPFSTQWQLHNVDVIAGGWTDNYLNHMENFSEDCLHDDLADGSSDAFTQLANAFNWRALCE